MVNLISLCLFLSFISFVLRQWMKPKSSRKLPPGPRKLPLIGNLYRLVGPNVPHVTLRDLSKQFGKDLMHLQLGEVPAVVVSSAEVAKLFLKTHDLDFASRPRVLAGDGVFYDRSDIVFCPYGEYWRQMRKVCMTELLSARTVRSFSYIREDESHRLLDRVRSSSGAGRPINIVDEVTTFMTSIITRAAFGKIPNRTEELVKVVNEIMILASSFRVADAFPSWKILHFLTGQNSRMVKVRKETDEIMGDIIKEHRNNLSSGKTGSGESGSEDIVDVLIKLKDSDSLPMSITDDNIKAVILDLFGGAVDTSTTTTVCAMVEMVKNPRVLAKAQAEVREVFKGKGRLEESDVEKLAYLNLVIKETLRLHPPASLLYRENKEESVVCGYTIPPRTRILINAWAISRDPKYWEDPESFKPERFEDDPVDFTGSSQFKYMPFGSGRRMCPGSSFGLANVYTPLAHLLYHFDWELPHGTTPHTLKLTELHGLAIGIKNDIFFIAAPPPTAA
ncbi:PREDICTED: premnaspirodiene oxygenase-like [Ipomoea nil]|uniref:premnaspirodiene oxygenase-like n=1 Tax=Ipomoea nil TaxID=35883 RepID=UPI000900E866|nr:PREDICTED: premnaspirodiene oxygenase-like [Ipomoea nil]